MKSKGESRQIASWVHLGGYLLIVAAVVVWGFHTRLAGDVNGAASVASTASHAMAIKFYLLSLLGNSLLFYYCWAGVHHFGGSLGTLTGSRWPSWRAIGVDIAIAVPFWVLWEVTAYGVQRLLGPGEANEVAGLLPHSLDETVLWIVVSLMAGFSEEIQLRGYLQQQFHALSGSLIFAVIGQALVFGLMHSYQGWRRVVVIAVLGLLYGMLAAWRKNLRANMIAHAWSDVWSGWLRGVLWR